MGISLYPVAGEKRGLPDAAFYGYEKLTAVKKVNYMECHRTYQSTSLHYLTAPHDDARYIIDATCQARHYIEMYVESGTGIAPLGSSPGLID